MLVGVNRYRTYHCWLPSEGLGACACPRGCEVRRQHTSKRPRRDPKFHGSGWACVRLLRFSYSQNLHPLGSRVLEHTPWPPPHSPAFLAHTSPRFCFYVDHSAACRRVNHSAACRLEAMHRVAAARVNPTAPEPTAFTQGNPALTPLPATAVQASADPHSRVLVAELVVKVLADLLQNRGGDFGELNFAQLCLREAACGHAGNASLQSPRHDSTGLVLTKALPSRCGLGVHRLRGKSHNWRSTAPVRSW